MKDRLKEYMSKHDLKHYELARKLGTTEANISRWVNGKHEVSKAWRELIKLRLK